MPRGAAVAALLLLAGCRAPPLASPAAPARHRAILASFDALNQRRALETLPADAIPALRALFEQGACADYARPAWPSKTAPSHASLWTGAYGDVNGVAANWQPPLPRDRHRITELVSGYSAATLSAEPIWATAAIGGLRVVAHHPTQAPSAADSALTGAVVLNGYNRHYAPDLALTARKAAPRPAIGWRGLEGLGSTLPPREIAWRVGEDSVFALLYGRGRYAGVVVSASRDLRAGVTARVAPVERQNPRGRVLARHFSDPLALEVPGGRVYLRVRLFALAPDGSDFLLFQPALSIVEGNSHTAAEAYGDAIGGWVGNGAQDLLLDGSFGPTLDDGGDGEAELRYLESLELVTRQFIRGSEWSWTRHPDLLLDYFPAADEADHLWYGYVVPGSPAYRADLAQAIQTMRARAWTLVDLRLAGLRNLIASDSMAALFVSGDHGMRATWRSFRPNAALAAAGLLALDDSGRVDASRTRALAPDGLYVMVNTTDWLGGIVPSDSIAWVLATADSALNALLGSDGARVVTQTWIVSGTDSLGRGGSVGGGLYYETAPGYDWRREATGAATEEGRIGANHGFPSIAPDMHTVLCAIGPAFGTRRIGPARTIDAAPTVAAWLGIPAPRSATGQSLLDRMVR